ncbi:lysylphosphatidylglycerol synthase domain-containing protein [Streptomyces sp. 351MFTsu5.1]|uniref:lysylphosphatidylglycerol synthase domain-containing protein n=1 Tax=Streptomyces sp. 351MFTsu5.1 TaxID=1172180 RepID=UPI0003779B65|nr:lysylphosphatidylglycerol synthase domain-containing protein [Streptomyces sp. 351MFTsu5.1]
MTADQVTAPGRRRVYGQLALTLGVLTATGYLARSHWSVLETGALRLALADPGWLLVAATAAAVTWMCSALAQQGAVLRPLPARRLVAAQFAAGAAGQLVPAGLGSGAVNLRFLMGCGLSAGRAATALAVKATAGGLTRAALIAVLAAACPGVLGLPRPYAGWLVVAGAGAALAGLLAAVLWPRCRGALAFVLADIRAVHSRPCRALALWGGSLGFAVLHAVVLIAVTRAVALPLAPPLVALLYLTASSAAALLPTPGGLGSLDAALALALTAGGAPGVAAASAVLGYRLLTVWLPLLPGLLVLAVLVRRKAL